jgi:hypothetical protein
MTRAGLWLAMAAALLAGTAAAQGQPRIDPDWPCIQRRVPTIGARAVWSGPDLEAAGPWASDAAAAALAQKLASRRTPVDEIDGLLDAFVKEAGADKATRLTRVFAGVLELVNNERDRVLSGITRYARGQQRMAERIRDEADRISAVKDAPATQTPQELHELETRFTWDKRIFEDRSQSLTYVCEVPVLLEQRLGEIARRIEARL